MNCREVYHKQGIAVLQNLLLSTYMEIQKNGLLCLKSLASYCKNKMRSKMILDLSGVEMQKKETVEKLLEIILADKMDLPQIGLQVLSESLKTGCTKWFYLVYTRPAQCCTNKASPCNA